MTATTSSLRWFSGLLLAGACAFALSACDKSKGPDAAAASEGGGVADACAGYRPTDSCMDESTYADCQAAEARCPGEVQVMESCPLQFACPEVAVDPEAAVDASTDTDGPLDESASEAGPDGA